MRVTLIVLIGAIPSLLAANGSNAQLVVECIPMNGTTVVGGGDVVTIECFVTTDITRTYVGIQLDFPCTIPNKGIGAGSMTSLGITVNAVHQPEPWFFASTGGGVVINNQVCRVVMVPTLVPGQVTIPGGTTLYLATIRYIVADCASGDFNVILENYSDPPHFTDGTRFMEYPGNINNVLPFIYTPTTLTVETGTCCQGGTCVADDLNALCCSQTYPGASFFSGRSCADVLPCGLCTSDSECDDSDFCNGAEACDLISGDCIPGLPPVCDDGVFCNGAENCNEANGCNAGADPCPLGFTCDEEADTCIDLRIPTVSTWGLAALGLCLAIGAKMRFSRALRD